jgi:pilus assembly protein CpaE
MAILNTPTQSEGRCVVVFSTKGGVGKSILTANLGLALANVTRSPVCLLDLDVTAAGDLARMMRLVPRQVIMNYAKDLKKQGQSIILPLDQLVMKYGPPGQEVDVIQALSHPSQGRELEPVMIQSALKFLKSRYRYVLVDSKVLTDPLIAALDEANLILLVMTPDIVALYQTKWAMSTIESYLLPQELVKGVLNRAESRGGVGSKDARQAVPCEIIAEVPSDGKAMGSAINQGVPLYSLFRQSKISDSFHKLAEALNTTPSLFLSHQRIHQYRTEKGQVASPAVDSAPAQPMVDDPLNPAQPISRSNAAFTAGWWMS